MHNLFLLVLSPMGIIPCPTLTVALAGVFYGVTGVFLLHVYFDIPLMIITLYSLYNLKFLFKQPDQKKRDLKAVAKES